MIMVFVASLVALLLALDDVRGTMVTEEVVPAEEGKGSDVVVITRENFASTVGVLRLQYSTFCITYCAVLIWRQTKFEC